MLQGITTMPSVRYEPLEIGAARSSSWYTTSASFMIAAASVAVSYASVLRAPEVMIRCVSTSGMVRSISTARTPYLARASPVRLAQPPQAAVVVHDRPSLAGGGGPRDPADHDVVTSEWVD